MPRHIATIIDRGEKKEVPVCCKDFLKATRRGTDSEARKSLIHRNGSAWHMGTELAPLKRCPWCGTEVK